MPKKKFVLNTRKSRLSEFFFALSVLIQFIKGFRALHFTKPCITFFGSARFKSNHPYYTLTVEIAKAVSSLGFGILTGGGGGLMEAANKGAKQANALSLGVNIELPMEQKPNPYLDHFVNIKYFFVRKTLLLKYSSAFIIMPGGYGTMDEFFEAITLMQTKKINAFPIIIIGAEFHAQLLAYLHHLEKETTISKDDLNYFYVANNADEVIQILKRTLPKIKK